MEEIGNTIPEYCDSHGVWGVIISSNSSFLPDLLITQELLSSFNVESVTQNFINTGPGSPLALPIQSFYMVVVFIHSLVFSWTPSSFCTSHLAVSLISTNPAPTTLLLLYGRNLLQENWLFSQKKCLWFSTRCYIEDIYVDQTCELALSFANALLNHGIYVRIQVKVEQIV